MFDKHDAFDCVKVYIPKSTTAILKMKAAEMGLPLSRLCAIAIDNELDQKNAFSYPCELPTKDTDLEYTIEGGKIIQFLKKFPTGTGRDTLVLCRKDIGIEHRETLLAAYKELLAVNMIEEFKPVKSAYYHHPKYFRVRLTEDVIGKRKHKTVKELEKKFNDNSEG